eukprot:TRINITY_DN46624_c0_g1_i1.p1 TRINITY_DN46624_c0_g1~~TRINITY_DN46624_c0_g1_i1.p1  ORF type:complete len:736 (+),score=99.70 TRINITY_DN46624_c0_g1_i1:55-2262(+)
MASAELTVEELLRQIAEKEEEKRQNEKVIDTNTAYLGRLERWAFLAPVEESMDTILVSLKGSGTVTEKCATPHKTLSPMTSSSVEEKSMSPITDAFQSPATQLEASPIIGDQGSTVVAGDHAAKDEAEEMEQFDQQSPQQSQRDKDLLGINDSVNTSNQDSTLTLDSVPVTSPPRQTMASFGTMQDNEDDKSSCSSSDGERDTAPGITQPLNTATTPADTDDDAQQTGRPQTFGTMGDGDDDSSATASECASGEEPPTQSPTASPQAASSAGRSVDDQGPENITEEPDDSMEGEVTVTRLSAYDLGDSIRGMRCPYVKLIAPSVSDELLTQVQTDTNAPIWEEQFNVTVMIGDKLQFEVWDYYDISDHDIVGISEVVIDDLSFIHGATPKELQLTLIDLDGNQVQGTLQVTMQPKALANTSEEHESTTAPPAVEPNATQPEVMGSLQAGDDESDSSSSEGSVPQEGGYGVGSPQMQQDLSNEEIPISSPQMSEEITPGETVLSSPQEDNALSEERVGDRNIDTFAQPVDIENAESEPVASPTMDQAAVMGSIQGGDDDSDSSSDSGVEREPAHDMGLAGAGPQERPHSAATMDQQQDLNQMMQQAPPVGSFGGMQDDDSSSSNDSSSDDDVGREQYPTTTTTTTSTTYATSLAHTTGLEGGEQPALRAPPMGNFGSMQDDDSSSSDSRRSSRSSSSESDLQIDSGDERQTKSDGRGWMGETLVGGATPTNDQIVA